MDNSKLLKIKEELDIVDIVSESVDLSKKGRNYWGICPFHEDSNPSMSVSPDKQLFKCFVCGTGGDIFKFNSLIKKISFRDSLVELGKRVGVEIKARSSNEKQYSVIETRMIDVTRDAMLFFQYSLNTADGKIALEYAEKRGLSVNIRNEFLIGYAPRDGLLNFLKRKKHDEADIINASLLNDSGGDFFKNRLIFGLRNNDGKIVGFSARDLSGEAQAKYINSGESKIFSKAGVLYNYSNARESIRTSKEVFINEGFMDVIAMSKAGIKNSVGIMGTALTKNHIGFLRGIKVSLMLDGDRAGIAATLRSIKLLLKNNIETFVVKNMEDFDPDDILEKHGVEKLLEISKNKTTALEFVYELHMEKYKDLNPDNTKRFLESFSKYLNGQSSIIVNFYKNKMASDLNMPDPIFNTPVKKMAKKITTKKQIASIKPGRNYSYALVLSMLKHKEFIELYDKLSVNFTEQILFSVVRYIKNFANGSPKKIDTDINGKIESKVFEISKHGDFVDTPEEFLDLTRRIDQEWKKEKIRIYKVKLENTQSDDEKIKFASLIAVLKKELSKE